MRLTPSTVEIVHVLNAKRECLGRCFASLVVRAEIEKKGSFTCSKASKYPHQLQLQEALKQREVSPTISFPMSFNKTVFTDKVHQRAHFGSCRIFQWR